MLHASELRVGNYFELPFQYNETHKTGQVKEISKKQVLLNSKWFMLDDLVPISITKEVLLNAGFSMFNWLKDASVFQCNFFKCTLDDNGVSLFCDNLKNLKPVQWLHQLQNLYFDLTGVELDYYNKVFKSRSYRLTLLSSHFTVYIKARLLRLMPGFF